MKPIRYSKTNGALNIGGRNNKLTIFTREKCACFTFQGRRIFHFGKYWGKW